MSGLGSEGGGGIFTPVKTPQEQVLDTTLSILHKAAKTEDMGRTLPWEGRLGSWSVTGSEGLCGVPEVVETDAGRESKFLPGARTGAWVAVCCLVHSPGGHVGPLQSE